MVLIIAGCLAVSALTLLFPSTPTYDPWAWILWGREIAHLDLVTEGGPSWKPLPIFFTTPFSLFGQDLAPYLWLWVARAGGLLGCVMAYRMASRLVGGRRLRRARRACPRSRRCCRSQQVRARRRARQLGADARRGGACGRSSATSTAAATTRSTSAWRPRCCGPRRGRSSALYGLWLWFYEPRLRQAAGRLRLASSRRCWFLPEWWGADDPFRAGSRANAPNPGSAAFAAHPACRAVQALRREHRRAGRARARWSPSASRPWRGCEDASRARCSRSRRSASPGSRSWR